MFSSWLALICGVTLGKVFCLHVLVSCLKKIASVSFGKCLETCVPKKKKVDEVTLRCPAPSGVWVAGTTCKQGRSRSRSCG